MSCVASVFTIRTYLEIVDFEKFGIVFTEGCEIFCHEVVYLVLFQTPRVHVWPFLVVSIIIRF